MDTAEHTALHRLAAYGTLGPGGPNDHQLDGLQGRWLEGYVNGRLVAEGLGRQSWLSPHSSFPPGGPAIPVHVFESVDLPAHWTHLDDFEGPGYQRVVTTVRTPSGDVDSYIYVLGEQD